MFTLGEAAFDEMTGFMAYSPSFTGGVYVAAGDLNGDGNADIVTAPDSGGGPHVRAFNGVALPALLTEFMAYDSSFTGGVRVAVGDGNGNGDGEIITGPGPSGGPHVRLFE